MGILNQNDSLIFIIDIQEKLLNACERLYEAERALCELAVPQSWKDEAKAAWEEHLLNKKYSFISKNIQK